MTYSIGGYGTMLGDPVRMDAYVRALTRSVRHGDVVVDLGSGIGYFAVLACKLGAGKVYAIEPDDSIELARRVAQRNDCADRIEFIQALSTSITLPRKADVIVSDLRGVLPFHTQHIPSLIDARQRLVAPGGIVIPLRDDIWGAVVESPAIYQKHVEPWSSPSEGVDMSPVRHTLANSWMKQMIGEAECISDFQHVCTLDYETIDSPNVSAEVSWNCRRTGIGHGLTLWFDATLVPGIGFTNAPGLPEAIYGRAFLPFENLIDLNAGDQLTVRLAASLVGSQYFWRWEATAFRNGNKFAELCQSSMEAAVFPAGKLHKRRDDYVPSRTQNAEIAEFILARIDGVASLGSVARELAKCYPDRFRSWPTALVRVTQVVEKCT